MTVTYNFSLSNSNGFKVLRLIFTRWRGSVWQCIHKELVIWLMFYAAISIMSRCALDEAQKITFDQVVLFCRSHTKAIPITFLLGFYVSLVMNRWWEIFSTLSWPDGFCVRFITLLDGFDARAKALRRTILRQLILMFVITFRVVSLPVKKRFPTSQHMVDAGIMTKEEQQPFDAVFEKDRMCHWLPAVWITQHLKAARKEGYIMSDINLCHLLEELADFRNRNAWVIMMDETNIPLVYTQVAHLSVRFYFGVALLARQFTPTDDVDLYLPIFTAMQFIIYMGWIKVAEVGFNPWGEDDDDFEINFFIDRNLLIVNLYQEQLDNAITATDTVAIDQLPYTEGSVGVKTGIQSMTGSIAHVPVSRKDSTVVPRMSPEQEARRKASGLTSLAVMSLKRRLGLGRRTISTIEEEEGRKKSSVSTPKGSVAKKFTNGASSDSHDMRDFC